MLLAMVTFLVSVVGKGKQFGDCYFICNEFSFCFMLSSFSFTAKYGLSLIDLASKVSMQT